MRAQRDVRVAMRDGVALNVDVFLPDEGRPVPALLAMSPYGKDIQSLPIPPQPPHSPLYAREIEAGDPRYLTDHGYAHVIADVRGIGKSGDVYRGWMSPDEARDGYDLIEWTAAQPWCDGGIGMVGVSYFGSIQLVVAATQPPHLRAIMPFNAPADFYRESTYHGGILQTFYWSLYQLKVLGRMASTVVEKTPLDELDALLERLSQDPDLQQHQALWNIARNPDRNPCFFDVLAQPLDGPWYRERSPAAMYDDITVPAYCGSGWWAYGHQHLRGAFRNYTSLRGTRKLFIEGRTEAPAPLGEEFNAEVVRWYDQWLKGVETGILEEPPIQIHVRGEGMRSEHEWPLARVEWTELHLGRWNALQRDPEAEEGHPDVFVQQPLAETADVASVDYRTDPLTQDLELTGPVAMVLYAAIDADDTNWIVALSDVEPAGRSVELSRGFLKASHRALDPEQSRPWLPHHPHLDAEPVPQGEIVRYDIELSPLANVFRAGHRIALSITSMDHRYWPPTELEIGGRSHMPWHVCSSSTVTHRVYHGPLHPSHLLVPVVPR